MSRVAAALVTLALVGCAGKINNKPANMPGSPAEAEQMLQSDTPDKAPPSKNETPPEDDEDAE